MNFKCIFALLIITSSSLGIAKESELVEKVATYFVKQVNYVEYSDEYVNGFFKYDATFEAEAHFHFEELGYIGFSSPVIRTVGVPPAPIMVDSSKNIKELERQLCEMIGLKPHDYISGIGLNNWKYKLPAVVAESADNTGLVLSKNNSKELTVTSFGCAIK